MNDYEPTRGVEFVDCKEDYSWANKLKSKIINYEIGSNHYGDFITIKAEKIRSKQGYEMWGNKNFKVKIVGVKDDGTLIAGPYQRSKLRGYMNYKNAKTFDELIGKQVLMHEEIKNNGEHMVGFDLDFDKEYTANQSKFLDVKE